MKCDLRLNNNRWRTWKPVTLALCSQTNQINHDYLLLEELQHKKNVLHCSFRVLDSYSHCQKTWLIFQSANGANAPLCVSIVIQNKPKFGFQCELMIKKQIISSLPLDRNEAKPRTFAANTSQGSLWEYLLPAVARYSESTCEAELRLRLLEVCLCIECVQTSRALLFYSCSCVLSARKS